MDPVLKSSIVSLDSIKSKKASPIIGRLKYSKKSKLIKYIFSSLSAHFQNGSLTNTDKIIVKRVEEAETDKKYALVATPESVYKADISSQGSAYVNTFLAIRNKRTNEISLVQVQEASFMVRR